MHQHRTSPEGRPPHIELINCHDCEKPISFSAAACPQCGSIEPRGPYRHSRREIRRHRIEERNDRTLIVFMVVLGAIGAFYALCAYLVVLDGPVMSTLFERLERELVAARSNDDAVIRAKRLLESYGALRIHSEPQDN
jgi:hypothetical protein